MTVCAKNFTFDFTSPSGAKIPVSQQCTQGIYYCSYTPKLVGTGNLSIFYQGEKIGPTFNPKCIAGQVYAPKSTAVVPSKSYIAEQTQFTVLTKDVNGNVNTSCNITNNAWTLKFVGASTGQAMFTNCSNGTYIGYYNGTQVGFYTLSISLNGQYVQGSPFSVTLNANQISPQNCRASGPGSISATAGMTALVTVQSVDQYSNPILLCPNPSDWNGSVLVPQSDQSMIGNVTVYPISCDSSTGITKLNYMIEKSVYYDLYLYINMTGLATNGRDSVQTFPSPYISASASTVSGQGIYNGSAGEPSLLDIATFDSFGNPLTNCNSSFNDWTIIATNLDNTSITCIGSIAGCAVDYIGQYTCNITGEYLLDIQYKGDPVGEGSYLPFWSPGPINAQQTTASGDGLTTALAGVEAIFYLDAFDQFGNSIEQCLEGQVFEIYARLSDLTVTGQILSCTNGTYQCGYNITKLGAYSLTIFYDGLLVAESPYPITTYPGPPFGPLCTTVGQGLNQSQAGDNANFTIQCADQFNNNITQCLDLDDWKFYLNGPVTGHHHHPYQCSNASDTDQAITYFAYNETVAGYFNLSIIYEDELVQSFYPVIITPGLPDPFKSVALGDGVRSQAIPAGTNTSFAIYTADRFGNTISECTFGENAYNVKTDPPVTYPPYLYPCVNGVTNGTYVGTKAQDYGVYITYNGTDISGSPYPVRIVSGEINATTIFASGIGLINATAGVNGTFNLSATDIYGNPVDNCVTETYNEFTITLSGADSVNGSIVNCTDGIYEGSYNATIAGYYVMHVEYEDTEIQNGPFMPYVVPAATFDHTSVVYGPGFDAQEFLGQLTAGVESYFIVSARDAYGNQVHDCLAMDLHNDTSDYWHADIIGPQNLTLRHSNCSLGNYTFVYDLTKAGYYAINVYGPVDITSNSPGAINLNPAGFYSGKSYIEEPQGTIIGNPMALVPIQAIDEFNNTIMVCNATIYPNFSITAYQRENQWSGIVNDCLDGVYMGYVQVNISGEYNVIVEFNDIEIFNSPYRRVYWYYGPVEATYSNAYGPGVTSQNIIAGAGTHFWVDSYNPYGLFIPICPPTNWSVDITPQFSNYSSNQIFGELYCANGTSEFYYNATTAGSYEVDVSLNGTSISGSPYEVRVVPTYIDPEKTLVLNRTGKDTGTFFLQIRDIYGNDETNLTKNAFGVLLSPTCANQTVNFHPIGGYLSVNYSVMGGGLYCIVLEYLSIEIPIANSSFTVVGGLGCSGSCSYNGYCIYDGSEYSCACQEGWIESGDTYDCGTKRTSKYPLATGAWVGMLVGISVVLLIIGLALGYFVAGRLNRDRAPLTD